MILKPPGPPFTRETAIQKVRMAEDSWNSRDAHKVALGYTEDSWWRNRSTFLQGRPAIVEFLTAKWQRELDYRLIKELWAHADNRIAVRFCYEYHDGDHRWFRAYGNENWQFEDSGLMHFRHASINDVAIDESARLFTWDNSAVRPSAHPGLSELGL